MTDKTHPKKLAMHLFNGFMRAVLFSPLHRLASRSVMVLYFNGRKSGRPLSTPISYVRSGGKVTCFTASPWWKNLAGGAPVRVLIQRRSYEGWAVPCPDDHSAIEQGLASFLTHVPSDARFYGVTLDAQGTPDPEGVAAAARRLVMIEIHLNGR